MCLFLLLIFPVVGCLLVCFGVVFCLFVYFVCWVFYSLVFFGMFVLFLGFLPTKRNHIDHCSRIKPFNNVIMPCNNQTITDQNYQK